MVKRLCIASVLVCIPLFLVVSIALSQMWLATITSTVNVVSGVKEIIVYSDPELTNPITSLDFGDVERGSSAIRYFYIRNTGNEPLNIVMETSDIGSWATVTLGPAIPFYLSSGSSASCWMELQILLSATSGVQIFNLYIGE